MVSAFDSLVVMICYKMPLVLRMNGANINTIEMLSSDRWQRFLLRVSRAHDLKKKESAMSLMREVIASTTCRLCMVQYALERGIIAVHPAFYECPRHGSATLAKFPEDISIFRIRELLIMQELEMKEEDWEVAGIMDSVKRKLDMEDE